MIQFSGGGFKHRRPFLYKIKENKRIKQTII